MEFKDYYKILGIPEIASADDIKKSYRKLARKYHPDVSTERNAEERFKEVGEAYEVLKDKEKRAEYDQLRKMGAQGRDGSFRPPPGWQSQSRTYHSGDFGDAEGFSDFFESIFGDMGGGRTGGFTGSGKHRGEDVHAKLALLLEEAAQGGEKQISFRVTEVDENGLTRQHTKTLNVKIPAGIGHGQHMRLRGQGGPGVGGGEAGDLFIEIELAPHPLFSVDGKDLLLTLPVTPAEAALGATVTVPTLDGGINLKVPAGSSGGRKLRLRGKGLPGKNPGDLIVVLQIAMPAKHSEKARELYAQLAETEGDFNPRANLKNANPGKVKS